MLRWLMIVLACVSWSPVASASETKENVEQAKPFYTLRPQDRPFQPRPIMMEFKPKAKFFPVSRAARAPRTPLPQVVPPVRPESTLMTPKPAKSLKSAAPKPAATVNEEQAQQILSIFPATN